MMRKTKWWILLVTTSGTSLVFLDNTVMPVALPTIQKELHFSEVGLVWVVNAYLLSLTALLLIGGRLSDLFGRRFLFMWGLFLFGMGSLLGGLSLTNWLLLTSRILQGIGGALTIPATGALLISTFPEGERARAIGLNSGISSVFLILGPALGGFLTEYLSWRSIFFINLPIVVFGMTMAAKLLKAEKHKNESFHFSGAFAMLIGVVTFVVGLMQANEWGWTSPVILTLLFLGPLFFAIFIWWSLHAPHPIIDFNFFRNSRFTAASLTLFISQLIVMVTVLWAIYFQQHLEYSPVQTGLIIFIATLPVFLMAPLGGYFADKVGPRAPMLTGFIILTFALFWLLFTVAHHSIVLMLPGLMGFGFGLPLILSPTIALALTEVDPTKLGAASGITTETRQLASTTGIAIMTAVYQSTVKLTGSHVEGFSAISILAGILSLIGCLVVILMVKKKKQGVIAD
jgi:EmrB/QacA subfamily drug resistance transporter